MPVTYDTLFETELRKRIAAEREEMQERLRNGSSVQDFADYKRYVGYFAALKDVEEWCAEVQTKLNQR